MIVVVPNVYAVRPVEEAPSPKGFRKLANFDLDIGPDIRMRDLRLVESPSGELVVYSPETRNGYPSALFRPELRAEIAALVKTSLEKKNGAAVPTTN